MPRLVLMRHAKSAYPVGVADRDRPLAERGRREAPRMAAPLAAELSGSVRAMVSTAVRAQQTWDLVATSLAGPIDTEAVPELYEAGVPTITRCIRSVPDVGTVIVVGHNPGLADALRTLAEDGFPERFPTSAFAVLDCEHPWPTFDLGPIVVRTFVIAR